MGLAMNFSFERVPSKHEESVTMERLKSRASVAMVVASLTQEPTEEMQYEIVINLSSFKKEIYKCVH